MTFQLDTSGAVAATEAHDPAGLSLIWHWDDLSPFVQGYVGAVLRAADVTPGVPHDRYVAFSDLAPETLARIIADCEGLQSRLPRWTERGDAGSVFWSERQDGQWIGYGFPPLTIQLGDDGKVKFA